MLKPIHWYPPFWSTCHFRKAVVVSSCLKTEGRADPRLDARRLAVAVRTTVGAIAGLSSAPHSSALVTKSERIAAIKALEVSYRSIRPMSQCSKPRGTVPSTTYEKPSSSLTLRMSLKRPFACECRLASDHKEIANARQCRRHVLDDPVCEVPAIAGDLELESALAKVDKFHLPILDDLAYVTRDQAETSG